MRKFLEHTDLTRPLPFRASHNNRAFARMHAKRMKERERVGFTTKKFIKWMSVFAGKSVAYNKQMVYLWKWMKGQVGECREYTYTNFGTTGTESLILIGVSIDADGCPMIHYRTKTGKVEYVEPICGSPMFRHFEEKNASDGRWTYQ